MRQTLKIGLVVLVVAALATAGIALAQTNDDPDGVAPDGSSMIMDRLAPLIDDGTLTEAQAQAVADVLADGFPRPGRRGHGPGPEVIGDFLGLTPQELLSALEDGSTLAEIAEANGSSGAELIDFLVAQAEARLDEAVAAGRIEETEKAEKLAEITQRITAMVEGEAPPFGGGPRGSRGPEGRPGPEGAGFGGAADGPGTGV